MLVKAVRAVPSPRETVWSYLADPHRLVRLNANSTGPLDLTPDGPLHVGQLWREVLDTPLGSQEIRTTVTKVDHAAGRIELEGEGDSGLHVSGRIEITDASGGRTSVCLANEVTLPVPLLAGLLRGPLQSGTEDALERLAVALGAAGRGS